MIHETNRREPSRLRTRLRESRHDTRGIALQTVIIIVVLLAIAGSVAAVLLSRASDVTGELETQDVTATRIDTESECVNFKMGGKKGDWVSTMKTCTWKNTAENDTDVTKGRCSLVGGEFKEVSGSPEECKVTVT